MSKNVLAFALALALAVPAIALAQTLESDWAAEFRGGRAHINLSADFTSRRGHSNYGRSYPMSDLQGFAVSGGHVSFRIVREAGTLSFQGTGDDRHAHGTFRFEPSDAYRRQLAAMGYSNVTSEKQFIFAMGDLSVADIKEMEKATSDDLTTSQLVQMVDHGVDVEFVRGIAAAGFSNMDSDALVRTRDHGVTPEYIAAIRKLGANLTLEDYVHARDHGVSEDYIADMQAAGFKLNFDQLVNSVDHGVNADFVQELAELGYRDVSIRDLVRLRDHGVNPSFVRKMNKKYNEKLAISELVSLRDHGEN